MVDPISPQRVLKSWQTAKAQPIWDFRSLPVCELFDTFCGEIGSTILLLTYTMKLNYLGPEIVYQSCVVGPATNHSRRVTY